jgi:hypothetical protein
VSKHYPTFSDRTKAAADAKQALLQKFKSRTEAPVDEETRKAQLAEALARSAKREAAEEARRARVAAEKEQRALEIELKRIEAEEAEKQAAENAEKERLAEIERQEVMEAEQKARRDLRYAQRKARSGKR